MLAMPGKWVLFEQNEANQFEKANMYKYGFQQKIVADENHRNFILILRRIILLNTFEMK